MLRSSETLHGNAPDAHPIALMLVDVIKPLACPETDKILDYAVTSAN